MDETKNLCAQIPVDLHNKVRQCQTESGLSLSQYMTKLIGEYYENGGRSNMNGSIRTVAFQVDTELFERFKAYLDRRGISQKAFFIKCIQDAVGESTEEDIQDKAGKTD